MATYVELKGYEHGGNRKSRDQSGLLNLDEIAKELNISKTGLKRALRIERNLTDSMKELWISLRVYHKNLVLQSIKPVLVIGLVFNN